MAILNRLLGREREASRDVARERLRSLLVHDRARVSPQVLEMVKQELLAAARRYVDVDPARAELRLADSSRTPSLVATFPIRGPR